MESLRVRGIKGTRVCIQVFSGIPQEMITNAIF